MYMQSSGQYPSNERFAKVFRKMNSSYEDRTSVTHLPQSSTDNSLYGQRSIGYSQDRQMMLMKSFTPTKPKYHHQTRSLQKIDQQTALKILFRQRDVQINRERQILRTQFIPTSNGFKYILRLSQTFYLNLSWLHSVQQLEKAKLLILYYDMYHLSSTQTKMKNKLPKIQSLIIEFVNQKEMLNMLSAVNYIHQKYHDEDVEKLYHLLCGDQHQHKPQ